MQRSAFRPVRRSSHRGCVVAVVGVDGCGKSTVVAALQSQFSAEGDAVSIYFGIGAGRPSPFLRPFMIVANLTRSFLKTKPRGASHGAVSDQAPGVVYSLLFMAWATFVAIDRRMKLVAARRAADRGAVVIADRYPQDEIVGFNDGPLLPRLDHVPAWLRRFEVRAYALARDLPPDLVIRLDVSAEAIEQREPDMDPLVIHERVEAVRRLAFSGARIVSVDAEQPLPEVVRLSCRTIRACIDNRRSEAHGREGSFTSMSM